MLTGRPSTGMSQMSYRVGFNFVVLQLVLRNTCMCNYMFKIYNKTTY